MRKKGVVSRGVLSGGFPWWFLVLLGAATAGVLWALGSVPRSVQGVAAGMGGQKETGRSRASQQPGMGSWTSPLNINTVGIHAALLYTGQVLLWYRDQPYDSGTGSQTAVWNPQTGVVQNSVAPFNFDIFCAGMSELPNGQILVTGGKDDATCQTCDNGIPEAVLYNPATNTWTQAANMSYARWYPTNVELANGTTLVASGDDEKAQRVLQMEEYNYSANTFTVLPASANMSSTDTYIYPRMVLLTSGNVFMGGMYATSMIFNTTTNTWRSVGNLQFGQRIYGAMVLLPGLERVLQAGGDPLQDQSGTATNTAEVIDFSQPVPEWTYVAPMNEPRQNESLVLLPDGTVLAVGGGKGGGRYSNPVYQPEIYNPVANTWTLMNPQQAQRTYHSTALLLADGRVMSAGSDTGPNADTLEVFSPPYLSLGPRPTITSAPPNLAYNQAFTIETPQAAQISRVALIKVATNTHATRFDERFVDLEFKVGSGSISAKSPLSGAYAPPGYYMLDIVNSNGVPAVMSFVLLSATGT